MRAASVKSRALIGEERLQHVDFLYLEQLDFSYDLFFHSHSHVNKKEGI